MRLFAFLVILATVFVPKVSHAQFASQMTAAHLATLKAVMEYKINDEENLREVEQLREDPRFLRRLDKMVGRLQNTRSKDNRNRRIQRILERAGRDVFELLRN